jgi:hypothetical protein
MGRSIICVINHCAALAQSEHGLKLCTCMLSEPALSFAHAC